MPLNLLHRGIKTRNCLIILFTIIFQNAQVYLLDNSKHKFWRSYQQGFSTIHTRIRSGFTED